MKILALSVLLVPLALAQSAPTDLDSVLLRAVAKGETEEVRDLIDRGANVNAKGPRGLSSLMVGLGHLETMRLLLAKRANVNARTDDGVTALMFAAMKGQLAAARLLVDSGADINAQRGVVDHSTAITLAREFGHEDVSTFLRDSAESQGVRKAIQEFLPANQEGDRNLQEAYKKIQAKKDEFAAAQASLDHTLGVAAGKADTNEVLRLLKLGANLNARDPDSGFTALMVASFSGHTTTCDLLLSRRAFVDSRDNDGNSALMMAVMRGHIGVVRLLLQHGANSSLKNSDGLSALQFAQSNDNVTIVALLRAQK